MAAVRNKPYPKGKGRYVKSRDGQEIGPREIQSLPSNDHIDYYDPPSPGSSDGRESPKMTSTDLHDNRGKKLQNGSRWARQGKMYAWGPNYDQVRQQRNAMKRMQICLDHFLPASADDGVFPLSPEFEDGGYSGRMEYRKEKLLEEEYMLPHLRELSPPASSAALSHLLAIPQTYTDILLNASMRHSLGEDTPETGLQRTAAELLEGERGLMQALGRLREVLRVRERDVPEEIAESLPNGEGSSTANGNVNEEGMAVDNQDTSIPVAEQVPALPHISETDNLWRVTQELLQSQPPPQINYTVTPPGAGVTGPDQPKPTPVQRLFTCPTGITVNSIPNSSHPAFAGVPLNKQGKHVKYNLDLNNQCRAVDDALERIAELLADCNEYKERLEEARDRVADVARAKKRVWAVIKERASWEMDREGV